MMKYMFPKNCVFFFITKDDKPVYCILLRIYFVFNTLKLLFYFNHIIIFNILFINKCDLFYLEKTHFSVYSNTFKHTLLFWIYLRDFTVLFYIIYSDS